MSYNGWSNRATWNVSLWLNNDEGLYRELQSLVSRASDVDELAEKIEELTRAIWGKQTPDGDSLDEADFEEIATGEWSDAGRDADTETVQPESTPLDSFISKHGLKFECHRVDSRPDGLMEDSGMRHFRCRISKAVRKADRQARIAELQKAIAEEKQRIFGSAKQRLDDNGKVIEEITTCGNCGLSWNDALITSYTPAPSARCPYEYIHPEVSELKRLQTPEREKGFGLYFSQGSAHTAEPTLADVLDCLASDASGYENAKPANTHPQANYSDTWFEEWASEYGYEADSRKAEKTFRAIKRQAEQLKRTLGEEAYQELLWNTERL